MTPAKAGRVILFPFMAQGHLIPFTEFGRLLERRTPYKITIISTPLNVQELQTALPSDTTIQLFGLPFNSSDHGLPPHLENYDSLPRNLFFPFLEATIALEDPFERLLLEVSQQDGQPPLCLLSDVFLGWTTDVAKRLGIFHAIYLTSGACGMAGFFSIWLHLPHLYTDSDEFGLPGFPESYRLHRSQLDIFMRSVDQSNPICILNQRLCSLALRTSCILCNTVEEMETLGLKSLRQVTGLPVWAVGPSLPPALFEQPSSSFSFSRRGGKVSTVSSERYVAWLNLHPPSTVIFISFGSQSRISTSQMMELAMGLEASGKPFIWVLRSPTGDDLTSNFKPEWLPEGFHDRVRERKQGLLVYEWAPQLEILSHKSTGAFLSHCGWNSILESLSQGVPIIGWPLMSDQLLSSKMLVENLGVCVELARGIDANVVAQEVQRVIELVMGGTEKGEELKRKAIAVSEMMKAAVNDRGGKGSSVLAIDEFLGEISGKRMLVDRFYQNGTETP